MKKIIINTKEYLDFTKKQHIDRHTKKENTHEFSCAYCEGVKK